MGYTVSVDAKKCIGCGACTAECPENFELVETPEGYKAKPKKAKFTDDRGLDKNKAAADICPVQAIIVKKA